MSGMVRSDVDLAFDPVEVALEFVGHSDPVRRVGAATALRAIGTPEAAMHLARMTIAELTRPGRDRMKEQLAKLLLSPGSERAAMAAVDELVKFAQSTDRDERVRAFDTLLSLYESEALEVDERSVALIVDAASDDDIPASPGGIAVEKHAEDALLRLEVRHRRRILVEVAKLHAHSARRRAVTLMLGRLRRRGFYLDREARRAIVSGPSVTSVWRRVWDRLSSAWQVADAHLPPYLPSPYLQGSVVIPSLVTALVGAALVVTSVTAFSTDSNLPSLAAFYPLLVLVSVSIAMLLALAATSRSSPLFVHHDTTAATAVAMVRAGTFTTIVVATLVLTLMLIWEVPIREVMMLGAVTLGLAPSVRFGSIMGVLAMPSGREREGRTVWWPTQIVAVLSGAGAGLCILFSFRWFCVSHMGSAVPYALRAGSDAMLMFLAPSTGAVAAAYAVLERPVVLRSSTSRRTGRRRAVCVFTAGGLALIAGLAVSWPIRAIIAVKPRPAFEAAGLGERLELRSIVMDPRRAQRTFAATFPQAIVVRASTPRTGDRISIFYKEPVGRRGLVPACSAESAETLLAERVSEYRLQWGCFKAVLERAQPTGSATGVLVEALLRARLRVESDELAVVLNSSGERGEITLVTDRTEQKLVTGASRWLLTDGVVPFRLEKGEDKARSTDAFVRFELLRSSDVLVGEELDTGGCNAVLRPSVQRRWLGAANPFEGWREKGTVESSVVLREDSRYRLVLRRAVGESRDECGRARTDATARTGTAVSALSPPPYGLTVTRYRIVDPGIQKLQVRRSEAFFGVWRVNRVPFTVTFVIPDERQGSVRVPPTRNDLVLTLRSLGGAGTRIVEMADDPEEISRILPPGEYELTVELIGRRPTVEDTTLELIVTPRTAPQ